MTHTKSQFITTISGVSTLQSFAHRINPNNSIFTAEAWRFVKQRTISLLQKETYLCLSTVSQCIKLKQILLATLQRSFMDWPARFLPGLNSNKKTRLVWTPGLSLIQNEKADYLTKWVIIYRKFVFIFHLVIRPYLRVAFEHLSTVRD